MNVFKSARSLSVPSISPKGCSTRSDSSQEKLSSTNVRCISGPVTCSRHTITPIVEFGRVLSRKRGSPFYDSGEDPKNASRHGLLKTPWYATN